MAVLKCKMCGGDIDLSQDKTFGTCEHCGNTMTFPRIDDEQRAAAFNRGNHFRRIGEFDKALEVYEHILTENDKDSEAHWCCALSRFGIEYVEDPVTFEWIPTCHRASFDNFLEDVDYLAAVEYSDGVTRRQYQKDAVKIAEVQKGILATSQNEDPFDVFICYKESDDKGERTVDSALAQDIYYQLTDHGYRVFFARITLEDKAGTEYEPYIFAALNSAKVMITVGTKPEYYNATWVKNEWSRFLAMMKRDRSKLLLPCYRDMNPYDMPEALSVLQSYDMSKIGFVQDLIRGISKVIGKQEEKVVKEQVVIQQKNKNNMVERGYLALEDKDWKSAQDFFEQALNIDSHLARAYLGKFLAEKEVENVKSLIEKYTTVGSVGYETKELELDETELKVLVQDAIIPNYLKFADFNKIVYFNKEYVSYVEFWKQQYSRTKNDLQNEKNYIRALEFAKNEELEEIQEIQKIIFEFFEEKIRKTEQEERDQIEKIEKNYKEHLKTAPEAIEGLKKIALEQRDKDFETAVSRLNSLENSTSLSVQSACVEYDGIIEAFQKLGNYKTSKDLIKYCKEKQNQYLLLKESMESKQRVIKKVVRCIPIVLILLFLLYLWKTDYYVFLSLVCFLPGILLIVLYICLKGRKEQSQEEINNYIYSIPQNESTYNWKNKSESVKTGIEFNEIVKDGKFINRTEIIKKVENKPGDEPVYINSIPFTNTSQLVELNLISTISRKEPEFYFKPEDEADDTTKYCLVITHNSKTQLYGVSILEPNKIIPVLEEMYTDIQICGQRVFYGVINEEVEKCVLLTADDILDFTDYQVEEYATVGQFDVYGVKLSEKSDAYSFYIVKCSDEEDEELEDSWFTIQTEEDINRFAEGIITFIDDEQEDKEEVAADYLNFGVQLKKDMLKI